MASVKVTEIFKNGSRISQLYCEYPDDDRKTGWYSKEDVMSNINKGVKHITSPEPGKGRGAEIVPVLTTVADGTEANNLGNVKERK